MREVRDFTASEQAATRVRLEVGQRDPEPPSRPLVAISQVAGGHHGQRLASLAGRHTDPGHHRALAAVLPLK